MTEEALVGEARKLSGNPPPAKAGSCRDFGNSAVMPLTGLNYYINTSDAAVASPVPELIRGELQSSLRSFIMSIRKSILVLSLALPALSAFALDNTDAVKSTQLKDGSIVHEFKDGKMAMEDKFGRAVRMQEGTTMETANGQSITMKGDEVAKLSASIYLHNRN